MNKNREPYLELVYEARINDLLKGSDDRHFEASGIYLKDGYLHIIFDNMPSLLRIRPDWRYTNEEPALVPLKGTGTGYEDITFHSSTGRWFCLIEAVKTKSDVFISRIDEFDESFSFIRNCWLDVPFKDGNKGFEGLAVMHHAGDDYLLCLCEGNDCKGGHKGAEPGKGRIQVFKQGRKEWEHEGTIKLPGAVQYKDYVSLDLYNEYLAVITQASSALWIGRIQPKHDNWDDLFEDDGQSFLFPRDEKGRTMYCNVEGVTWLENDRLVVVSDKAKQDQPGRCTHKDQSIHIFKLPDEGLPMR